MFVVHRSRLGWARFLCTLHSLKTNVFSDENASWLKPAKTGAASTKAKQDLLSDDDDEEDATDADAGWGDGAHEGWVSHRARAAARPTCPRPPLTRSLQSGG